MSVDREPYSFNELLSAPIFAETMPKAGAQYHFSRKLSEIEIGGWLAQAFWQDGHFLGMKLMHRAPDGVAYQVFAEEFSLQVLGLFFERASGKKILGVKNHGAWTVLPVRNVHERILAMTN
ncbi:hypothetical protein HUU05_22005 [candidate division KSB1 bacterium]|nr:hypothetical protein [candidate division KSB1 bacterium]